MLRKVAVNVWGIAVLVLSLFLTIALLTHSSSDPSFNRAADVEAIGNAAGIWGAYVAGPFIQAFGASMIFPVLFLYSQGFRLLLRKPSTMLLIRFCVLMLLIPISCLLLSIASSTMNTGANYGGLVGSFLLNEVQLKYNVKIAFAICAPFALIGSIIAFNIRLRDALQMAKVLVKLFLYAAAVTVWLFKLSYAVSRKLIRRLKRARAGNSDALDDEFIEEEEEEIIMPKPKAIVEIVSKPKNQDNKAHIQSKLKLEPDEFDIPSTSLLREAGEKNKKFQLSESALSQNSILLQQVLEDFGIQGEILKIHPGPVVTLYEFEPAAGTKSSRVIGLSDDIARSMSAVSARIAVIPGKSALGIELPNAHRETVYLRELLESKTYQESPEKLPLVLGKNIAGESVIADLSKMPHLLVAGTTGSGKSVAINTMILSLLYKHSPEQCKFIMVDPKMLELSIYDGIPHLLAPVVTDPKKAVSALKWVVKEMENRYRMMSILGVRNLDGFNKIIGDAIKSGKKIEKQIQIGFDSETGKPKYESVTIEDKLLPYIVVIVDEMADLMIVAGKEIESSIQRLAQMARAAGIHIIMATQRPSVDVITGVIKANFPTRISFQVTSKIDSRTILGEQGAEQLLGMGDMLFMRGGGRIERVHGPFVSDGEVEQVTTFLKAQGAPNYVENITIDESEEAGAMFDGIEDGGDDVYSQAVAIVLRDKKASTSYVQRCLRIGYNRAANIIERMEREGIVSAPNHVGKREILRKEE